VFGVFVVTLGIYWVFMPYVSYPESEKFKANHKAMPKA
jgi:hypothetical protein